MISTNLVILIVSLVEICTGGDADDLIVKLNEPQGSIRGHSLKSAKGNSYFAFQEIPYAAPPVGEKRFKAPELHAGWDGVLNASENMKACYQFTQNAYLKDNDDPRVESEDCLYLNVYTPVKPGSGERLPVYLYIHGGSFRGGSSYLFGPKYLIDGGIIIVTINYRLGPLGFLSTEDSVVPGNMGLKDQHLALQWTYENIELFGGNPKDIVVGGESAGSFATTYHLLSPKNNGLLSGIIQQSGSALGSIGYEPNPRQSAFALAEALLIPLTSDNTSLLVDALRQIPVELFKASAQQIKHNYSNSEGIMEQLPWTPIVEEEDENAFITTFMHQDFMDGNFNRVPCMLGFNSEESLTFLPPDSELQLQAAAHDIDPSLNVARILNVENQTFVGTQIRDLYTSTNFSNDLGAFVRFSSDGGFTRSTIRQAKLSSQYVPVYLYQFSAGKSLNTKYPGIGHGADLNYLWDLGDDHSNDSEAIREVMLTLWWNFIKYKNPTPENVATPQNISWPAVDSENLRYLNINETLDIFSDPRNYSSVEDVLLDQIRPPYLIF